MKESYLAVAGRIRRELEEIEAVVNRAQNIWDDVDPDRPADHRIDAVALNLHGFYAGLERIFKTIADRIDQTVPEGGSWHQELLEQMNAELNGIRPPVLSDEARNDWTGIEDSGTWFATCMPSSSTLNRSTFS